MLTAVSLSDVMVSTGFSSSHPCSLHTLQNHDRIFDLCLFMVCRSWDAVLSLRVGYNGVLGVRRFSRSQKCSTHRFSCSSVVSGFSSLSFNCLFIYWNFPVSLLIIRYIFPCSTAASVYWQCRQCSHSIPSCCASLLFRPLMCALSVHLPWLLSFGSCLV